MSADRLNEAAGLLRAAAHTATPGPWVQMDSPTFGPQAALLIPNGEINLSEYAVADYRGAEDAAYIATVHPEVGKALADWLDQTAAGMILHRPETYSAALAVADAILGTT